MVMFPLAVMMPPFQTLPSLTMLMPSAAEPVSPAVPVIVMDPLPVFLIKEPFEIVMPISVFWVTPPTPVMVIAADPLFSIVVPLSHMPKPPPKQPQAGGGPSPVSVIAPAPAFSVVPAKVIPSGVGEAFVLPTAGSSNGFAPPPKVIFPPLLAMVPEAREIAPPPFAVSESKVTLPPVPPPLPVVMLVAAELVMSVLAVNATLPAPVLMVRTWVNAIAPEPFVMLTLPEPLSSVSGLVHAVPPTPSVPVSVVAPMMTPLQLALFT